MSNYSQMLAQVDAQMEELPEAEASGGGEFKVMPDGKYTVRIKSARVSSAPWGGDEVYLYVAFDDTESDQSDDKYIQLTNLSDKQLAGVKKGLLGLGYSGKLADLEESTGDLINNLVELNISTNGKYRNFYFNKHVGKAGTSDSFEDIWGE